MIENPVTRVCSVFRLGRREDFFAGRRRHGWDELGSRVRLAGRPVLRSRSLAQAEHGLESEAPEQRIEPKC